MAVDNAEPKLALAILITYLGSIQKGPNKPQQKLWAIKNVAIPRHQYPRVVGKSKKGMVMRFDKEISSSIKKA